MMRSDGYFIGPPVLFEDYIGGNVINSYLHKAYWFVDKRHVLCLVMKSKSVMIKLTKDQFIGRITIWRYIVESDILRIISDYETQFEVALEFNVISQTVFKDKERIYTFISWD